MKHTLSTYSVEVKRRKNCGEVELVGIVVV